MLQRRAPEGTERPISALVAPITREYDRRARTWVARCSCQPSPVANAEGPPAWRSLRPAEKRARWDLIRDLRNETTHASMRHLTTRHEALRVLDLLALEM